MSGLSQRGLKYRVDKERANVAKEKVEDGRRTRVLDRYSPYVLWFLMSGGVGYYAFEKSVDTY